MSISKIRIASCAIVVAVMTVGVVARPGAAHAQPASPTARPFAPYSLMAPTAEVPAAGGVEAGILLSRREMQLRALVGLGDVAALGITAEVPSLFCETCLSALTTEFRLAQQRTFAGTRVGIANVVAIERKADDDRAKRNMRGQLVVSVQRRLWALHGGPLILAQPTVPLRVRPQVALQWRAPQFPRTTLGVELRWDGPAREDAQPPGAYWRVDWGVTYRAFRHWEVVLAVEHRQQLALGDSYVFVGAQYFR